uniref:Shisa N-terminal domain-containing protein n=1 Tax=Salmo trutta TaxID=8032 RepID=A0A674E305_SALTR
EKSAPPSLLLPFSSGDDCEGYLDAKSQYHSKQYCGTYGGCCGTCDNRYCCIYGQSKLEQDTVIATTSHTTVVNTQFTQQPQQPIQIYQGGPQYPAYQPVPVQPGYGAQPQPGYGGGQPMPTAPGNQGQPFQPGPPPPYQETAYPPAIPVPYSQAGFSPGQPSYPFQPPAQPGYPAQHPGYPAQQPGYPAQAGAPPVQPDFLSAQPAYNPAFVDSQPPKTGY